MRESNVSYFRKLLKNVKLSKMKTFLSFLVVAIFLFTGCTNIDPINDTIAPEILIYVHPAESGSAKLIASSNTSLETPSNGCPGGTLLQGQNPNSFFMELPESVKVNVVSNDKGGVNTLSVLLSGNVSLQDVTNIQAINDPSADITTTPINGATVKIDVDFNNLRTAQILSFVVAADEQEGLIIKAESTDYNSHSTSLPRGNTGGTDHGGQIFDMSLCR